MFSSYLCSVCNNELFKFIQTTESEKNEIVLLLIERFSTFPSFRLLSKGFILRSRYEYEVRRQL